MRPKKKIFFAQLVTLVATLLTISLWLDLQAYNRKLILETPAGPTSLAFIPEGIALGIVLWLLATITKTKNKLNLFAILFLATLVSEIYVNYILFNVDFDTITVLLFALFIMFSITYLTYGILERGAKKYVYPI